MCDVLVVDPSAGSIKHCLDAVSGNGYGFRFSCVCTLAECTKGIKRKKNPHDIIMLDLFLSDSQGANTFQRVRRLSPRSLFIILSKASDLDIALSVVKLGAHDIMLRDGITADILLKELTVVIAAKERMYSRSHLKALRELVGA